MQYLFFSFWLTSLYMIDSRSIHMSAAAAAKLLQLRPTLRDPRDGRPPGSPSLGFSRQEHWSGLPFPSPMHESEKWKWSHSFMSDSGQPHGLQPTRLLHPWIFQARVLEWGAIALLSNCLYFRSKWESFLPLGMLFIAVHSSIPWRGENWELYINVQNC